MSRTVLSYVQTCLSVMDSDNVDDINDTVESLQVANALEQVYYETMNRQDWPHLNKALTLTAAADVNNPTQFAIGNDVKLINELIYNVSEAMPAEYVRRELHWLPFKDFLERFSSGEGDTDKQLITVGSGVQFYVSLNQWPHYWTTIDDTLVVMDGVNQTYESTLTSTKLTGTGIVLPAFAITNVFEVPVPKHMESLIQAELNRECFHYFKQTESVPDERKAQRQLAQARRNGSRTGRREHGRKPGHGRC